MHPSYRLGRPNRTRRGCSSGMPGTNPYSTRSTKGCVRRRSRTTCRQRHGSRRGPPLPQRCREIASSAGDRRLRAMGSHLESPSPWERSGLRALQWKYAMIPLLMNAGARYLIASPIRPSAMMIVRTAAITSRFGLLVVASHKSTSALLTSQLSHQRFGNELRLEQPVAVAPGTVRIR
jgi:hypothetical protein